MTRDYVAAVRECGRALDSLEFALATRPTDSLSLSDVRSLTSLSADEALLAMHGLETLGVVRRTDRGWCRVAGSLERTRGFREGVRAATWEPGTLDRSPEILALAPERSSVELSEVLMRNAVDLRFGLLAMITEAAEELLLMSPFWDEATLRDLEPPLSARLRSGVRVILVTRRIQAPLARLRDRFSQAGNLRVIEWFNTDENGVVSTFHVKALIQDRGRRAYVGSANMTTASLRSRMELGFRFEGALAKRVAEVVYASVSLRC